MVRLTKGEDCAETLIFSNLIRSNYENLLTFHVSHNNFCVSFDHKGRNTLRL